MVITIIISFISLMSLLVLHEFGHFILAKKFGVRVEEFGIGYPPRLIGKKVGDTIYSINLLPFGAFVRLPGEIEHLEDSDTFSQKPIWQRFLIIIGGVLSFWIVSALIFSLLMGLGMPTSISDDDTGQYATPPKVQITGLASDSPAQKAGLKVGDTVLKFALPDSNLQMAIDKTKQLQDLTQQYRGKTVVLTISRGKEVFDVSLVPRVSPPANEGAMGVALARTAIKIYPWYELPVRGIITTWNVTISVVMGWATAIHDLVNKVPSEAQLVGPVGIFSLFNQVSQLGVNYFLNFVAVISIYLAMFNILPIPSVDGGKIMFLAIEAIRRKPVPEKIEQTITIFFFSLLILLMIFVTIKDVMRII